MKIRFNRLLNWLPYFLIGGFSFAFLFWFLPYLFFYQEKSQLFLLTLEYFAETAGKPGGFLVYLGNLKTAFYHYPLAGAIWISLEIIAVGFLFSKIIVDFSGRRSGFSAFLVGGLLLLLQANYQFQAFVISGILLQLIFFYFVLKIRNNQFLWVPALLFPVNYFLFGSFSGIFLILFMACLLFSKSYKTLFLLAVLALLFFIAGKEFLFFEPADSLLLYPLGLQQIGLQKSLFAFAIFLIVLLPIIFRFISFAKSIDNSKNIAIKLSPVLVVLVFCILSVFRMDGKTRDYFHVEKLFYEKKFDELIDFNRQNPSANTMTIFLNNLALSETGRLTDELFDFRQSADGSTLFLKWDLVTEVLKRGGWFYYSLGMVNEAQRWAYEYMIMRGNTPENIKMLIKTELINGDFKMAEKYISVLKTSPFYRKQALAFEKYLNNDSLVEKDSELGEIRKLKPKTDFFVLSDYPLANLDLILAADSTHAKALNYKLAAFLLQKDFENASKLLPYLAKAGFRKIPKNAEEAFVAYSLLNLRKYPETEGFEINPKTVIRFNEYYSIYQQNSGNKLQAQKALQNFSNTYWYYVFFY